MCCRRWQCRKNRSDASTGSATGEVWFRSLSLSKRLGSIPIVSRLNLDVFSPCKRKPSTPYR